MDCKICPFEDQFWKKPAFSHEDKMLLVKQYYGHSLDLSCFGRSLKLCGISSLEAARIVDGNLKLVSCNDIFDVIKKKYGWHLRSYTILPQAVHLLRLLLVDSAASAPEVCRGGDTRALPPQGLSRRRGCGDGISGRWHSLTAAAGKPEAPPWLPSPAGGP